MGYEVFRPPCIAQEQQRWLACPPSAGSHRFVVRRTEYHILHQKGRQELLQPARAVELEVREAFDGTAGSIYALLQGAGERNTETAAPRAPKRAAQKHAAERASVNPQRLERTIISWNKQNIVMSRKHKPLPDDADERMFRLCQLEFRQTYH